MFRRVNFLSKATDDFAKSVLSGVISTVGIIPNAIIKSSFGRAILKTAPGEVALASMISFCGCLPLLSMSSLIAGFRNFEFLCCLVHRSSMMSVRLNG